MSTCATFTTDIQMMQMLMMHKMIRRLVFMLAIKILTSVIVLNQSTLIAVHI